MIQKVRVIKMEYVISIALSVVSTVLAFILKSYISENKELRKEREEKRSQRETALEDGVVCLLRKQLMDDYSKYMELGHIPSKALESGLLMYKAYKGLGGNGMIDHMEDEIQNLPIRD